MQGWRDGTPRSFRGSCVPFCVGDISCKQSYHPWHCRSFPETCEGYCSDMLGQEGQRASLRRELSALLPRPSPRISSSGTSNAQSKQHAIAHSPSLGCFPSLDPINGSARFSFQTRPIVSTFETASFKCRLSMYMNALCPEECLSGVPCRMCAHFTCTPSSISSDFAESLKQAAASLLDICSWAYTCR